jgi:hypothetical protein
MPQVELTVAIKGGGGCASKLCGAAHPLPFLAFIKGMGR